jgi:hypothetical protein
MDRTIKTLKDDTAEPEAVETPKPASALSDFLAGGLRESQRPPPPGRESQRPSGFVRTSQPPASAPRENEAPVRAPAETVEAAAAGAEQHEGAVAAEEPESAAEAVAVSAGLAQAPDVDVPSEEAVAEELPPLDEEIAEAPFGAAQSESDFVVPVPFFSRPRNIAGAVAAVLLILVLSVLLTREAKVPPRADVPRETAAVAAHEPLPPAPPLAEPEEQIPDTEEEATPAERKAGGASAAPESSVSPPFGPNVARYPDLPTPVLIELEKAQEEKAATKPK